MPDPDPDYDFYREQLLERRRQLLEVAETGAASAATVELDQTRVGRLSRMAAGTCQPPPRAGTAAHRGNANSVNSA